MKKNIDEKKENNKKGRDFLPAVCIEIILWKKIGFAVYCF